MSKKFNLKEYKTTRKTASTPKKKEKYITLDKCMHSVLGMPGIPMGHITQIYGLSDTGKTSIVFHAMAQAQEDDILPVVVVTEGKVDWDRARDMGVKYYGDLTEEEREERGLDPEDEGFAIVVEDVETLEDMFDFIIQTLSDVEMGKLPHDIAIFVDSIGNTPSRKEFSTNEKTGEVKKDKGMMVAARVISEYMRIISAKVNNTLKISHPNYASVVFVNHAYTEPPSFPGGPSKLVPYGGKKIWYVSSLVLKTSRRSKLYAIKDKVKMSFGIISKIVVDKNHITNAAYEGEYVITANKILANDKKDIDNYKKENKESWGETLELEEHEES